MLFFHGQGGQLRMYFKNWSQDKIWLTALVIAHWRIKPYALILLLQGRCLTSLW